MLLHLCYVGPGASLYHDDVLRRVENILIDDVEEQPVLRWYNRSFDQQSPHFLIRSHYASEGIFINGPSLHSAALSPHRAGQEEKHAIVFIERPRPFLSFWLLSTLREERARRQYGRLHHLEEGSVTYVFFDPHGTKPQKPSIIHDDVGRRVRIIDAHSYFNHVLFAGKGYAPMLQARHAEPTQAIRQELRTLLDAPIGLQRRHEGQAAFAGSARGSGPELPCDLTGRVVSLDAWKRHQKHYAAKY